MSGAAKESISLQAPANEKGFVYERISEETAALSDWYRSCPVYEAKKGEIVQSHSPA